MRGGLRSMWSNLTAADLPDKASALALVAALCVLAAVTSLLGLLGLFGTSPATSDAVLDIIRTVGGAPLANSLQSPVEDLIADQGLALVLLIGGMAGTALLSWLYLGSFRRAAQQLAPDRGGLPRVHGGLDVLAGFVGAELIVATGVCVLVTGALAHAIGDTIGLSDDAVLAWDIVKWPALVLVAFVAFGMLQRSAFSDPRVLASSTVGSSHVLAALAWAFAATGLALYVASFGTFEDTYGTIGSGIVLLVWVTLFSMLYYVTPDLGAAGFTTLGAGAALSAVTWLLANAVTAVCIANFDSLGETGGTILTAAVFLGGLWVTNLVVLLGVHLNGLSASREDTAESVPVESSTARLLVRREDLVHAVGHALQNDVAHDGMLSPIVANAGEESRMSDLELDLGDWGFTYGVAWAVARSQDPQEPDDQVAERALAAARQVFRLYCGEAGWEERVRREIVLRRHPQETALFGQVDGNGHGGFELHR